MTVIRNTTLLDGTGSAARTHIDVVFDTGGIVEVRDSVPPGAGKIIDGTGRAVLPGLIDCHVHMDLHGYANTYEENLVEDKLRTIRAAREMERTLAQGFTTVRNTGSVNHIDFAVKAAIEEGYCRGPRVLTSGQIISMTAEGNDYFEGLYREANGPDAVRAAAR
jgi:imidazolonepropionase-like amidohydrolase